MLLDEPLEGLVHDAELCHHAVHLRGREPVDEEHREARDAELLPEVRVFEAHLEVLALVRRPVVLPDEGLELPPRRELLRGRAPLLVVSARGGFSPSATSHEPASSPLFLYLHGRADEDEEHLPERGREALEVEHSTYERQLLLGELLPGSLLLA